MNKFAKSALVLGAVGALALGSVTASEARGGGRFVAGAAGFAVGAAVGAAAANSAYGGGYGYEPGYDAPAYDSYAYAPGYRYRGGPVETRSTPRHYDPGAGYNSNTVAPWQDRKMQGQDY
jgi:hypothetical protein